MAVLPSSRSPWWSSRDRTFATPSPRGLGKVDTVPSNQGQSQGILSLGVSDLGRGTDQSQSQSLHWGFNYWERVVPLAEVAELRRQKPGKAWQTPKAHLRMKGPQRKAQLRERERDREKACQQHD